MTQQQQVAGYGIKLKSMADSTQDVHDSLLTIMVWFHVAVLA
jgi:hypothetical protein